VEPFPAAANDLVAACARQAATPDEAVEGAEVIMTALFGPEGDFTGPFSSDPRVADPRASGRTTS
jgi:hypothetical protein